VSAERAERLEAATAAAREVAADLHGALKDARAVLREIREAVERWGPAQVKRYAEETIAEQVAAGLASYQEALARAIRDADKAMERRFATLAAVYLGEDLRPGESLPELAERHRQTGEASR
jgi:hypothetical protein